MSGATRRTLLRSWRQQAEDSDRYFADWLQNAAASVIGSAHTGDGRSVLSTTNAGQSVTFLGADNLDPVSQAQAVALLTEAADVAQSLTYSDDDDLLQKLIQHLGTPIRASVNTYRTLRL
jgi:hypothetical protein